MNGMHLACTRRRALLAATVLGATLGLACIRAAGALALVISPLNGTPDASPRTQISFLGVAPGQLDHVSVVGSRSGAHAGRLQPYASEPGMSFLPSNRFDPGESVTVSALVGPPAHRERVSDSFTVAQPAPYIPHFGPPGPPPRPAPAGSVQSFPSQPGLSPPSLQVAVDSPNASPGDVLLAPAAGPGQHGPMIVDGAGNLVWFKSAPADEVAEDLQVERYQGQPVLVWWQGVITSFGTGLGSDEIYNTSYQPVAQIQAGNGYTADLHEAQILPSGAAFITAYALVYTNLSSAGGSSDGILADAIVQEVDVKTGLVMFEWHAYGHVALTDSYTHPGAAEDPWDWFHVNSVSLDPWGDGNFIISSRNTWTAYEISKQTGAILWRIGGRQPSFKMGAGTGTAWQHDARWQPDHTLTIFDDGSTPPEHSQSRAIRERINWRDRSVELIGRYVHTPPALSGSQGNYQLLPDGDSFVGWGEEPFLSEFSPSGQVLFSARLPPTGQSYRAYRFAWSAQPATPPAIAVKQTGANTQIVYASWNGATDVSSWRVLGGTSASALSPLAGAPRSGFQTAVPAASSDTWFAAQALGADGSVLGTSPPTQP
jgi:Arylsulfotransferase (ASST)